MKKQKSDEVSLHSLVVHVDTHARQPPSLSGHALADKEEKKGNVSLHDDSALRRNLNEKANKRLFLQKQAQDHNKDNHNQARQAETQPPLSP